MNKEMFHNSILRTIDECSYKFYVVKPNKSIKCICTNHTTKQANVECKKCLGTGYKIVIKRYYGASNDKMKGGASIGTKTSQIIKTYFLKCEYKIAEDDLIVDDNELYYAFRVEDMKGLKGVKTHQEVMAVKRKNDHDIALQNFKDILNRKIRK